MNFSNIERCEHLHCSCDDKTNGHLVCTCDYDCPHAWCDCEKVYAHKLMEDIEKTQNALMKHMKNFNNGKSCPEGCEFCDGE